MQVVVEFFGVAPQLTGARECRHELGQGANSQDAARGLASRCSESAEERLTDGGLTLSESFRLPVDGSRVGGLDAELKGDERLVLISAISGG
jgi:molybdopterin converting factor small subunit